MRYRSPRKLPLKIISRLICVLLSLSFLTVCSAEMPRFYKTVNRVTWIVENIDQVRPAWEKLGLSDIHEYPNIQFAGTYRGKPVMIWAWQITGHIGNLTIDMIQPAEGQLNPFTDFLAKHGDGIFSIVHEVSTPQEMAKEVQRMHTLGVGVLQQVSVRTEKAKAPITFTYFDTAPQGAFVLGLVYRPGGLTSLDKRALISHLAPVIHESAPVSAFWQKLGFPAIPMEQEAPRADTHYRDKPLSFSFQIGYQHYDQFSYEWIVPPMTPPNIYADFLKAHHDREGIQHIAMPVDDLQKAVANYESLGYHVRQSGAWGDVGKKDSGQYAYMDTDSNGGISMELVHAY